ncbi:hypothetical protein [Nocardia xishanensis]
MDKKSEAELHRDFKRWIELIDHAAHAENEVDREIPALQAVKLEQKWINAGNELWNTLHDLYEQWFDTVDRTRSRAATHARSAVQDTRSRPCA